MPKKVGNRGPRRVDPGTRHVIGAMLRNRIIPTLVETRTESPLIAVATQGKSGSKVTLSENDVADIADLLLAGHEQSALDEFDAIFEKGISARRLIVDVFGAVASHLGEAWVNDTASFADVTLGMAVLHKALRNKAAHLALEIESDPFGNSIMLSPLPNHTHVFGAAVVEEFFRAADWDVHSGGFSTENELLKALADEEFSIFGLSLGQPQQSDDGRRLISRIRARSMNQNIKIMVGGPAVVLDKRIPSEIGADGFAVNAEEALKVARHLLDQNDD
ncbi:MAG: cobalamin-dependent protein [Pseudomonadota bacterium]